MDKVQGGTPYGTHSICHTCRYAQVVHGSNLQEMVLCHRHPNHPVQLHFPVERCSVYDDKRNPALWDMKEIAWEIKSRSRGPMGFAGEESGLVVTVEPPSKERSQPAPTTAAE